MGKMLRWFLYFITLVAEGSAVAITGPQAGVNADTGERPFRQEFSVFKDSGAAFDLYIQALYFFEQENQSNLLSYFSIAGNCTFTFGGWVTRITPGASQAFMDIPSSHGMAPRETSKQVTVPMNRSCFLPGIGPTWLCSRFVSSPSQRQRTS